MRMQNVQTTLEAAKALELTWLWWSTLSIVTFVQAVLFLRFVSRSTAPRWARTLGLNFAVGACLRMIFPVRWSSRPWACLFSTPYMFLGSGLFDRLVAHTIEISFGFLVAFTHETHLLTLGRPRSAAVARLCALGPFFAQVTYVPQL